MTHLLRVEMLVLALIILFVVLRAIYKHRLLVRFSLIWFAIAAAIVIIAAFPGLVEWLCNLVQIQTASNLVYLLGILTLFAIALIQTELLSKHSEEIQRLTQELSLERLRREEMITETKLEDPPHEDTE